jgi:hypothetical protein
LFFLVSHFILFDICVVSSLLERFDANFASGNLVSAVDFTFKSLKLWISKLLVGVDSSDPETETVAEELTSASSAGTFNEWSSSKIFETRTWTGHVLSTTVSTFGSVSEEGVTHPHGVETDWAFWNLSGLRVNSNNGGWSFADVTSGDVLSDIGDVDGHHWHSSGSGQPVRFGISAGVSADVVVTAEGGWHGVKFFGARTGGTEILGVVVVVANGVKERVTRPKRNGTGWAAWV